MSKPEIAKVLLETILENHGFVRSCPIQYDKDTKKWFFWNESATEKSKDYNSLEDALHGLEEYCELLDNQFKGTKE